MKRILQILSIILIFHCLPSKAQDQKKLTQDTTGMGMSKQRVPLTIQEKRLKQEQYYRRNLGGDSLKAVQVSKVMEEYKTALYKMMEDKTLGAEARKSKMIVLMDTKNRKLSALLSPVQQSKLIPTSETSGRGLKKQTP